MNSVWTAPGRWNPTKWRSLATSATKTFRFHDIDGNPIKKQFRYVAKSYDRKWTPKGAHHAIFSFFLFFIMKFPPSLLFLSLSLSHSLNLILLTIPYSIRIYEYL